MRCSRRRPRRISRSSSSANTWPKFPRMRRLVQLFDLNRFEEEAVLICLAPELDIGYGRLYAYLQDDATRRFPTADLILRLLCQSFEARMMARSQLEPGSKLLANQLLVPAEPASQQTAAHPVLWRSLKVDDRILAFLLGSDALDARIAAFAHLHRPEARAVAESTVSQQTHTRLASLVGRGVEHQSAWTHPVRAWTTRQRQTRCRPSGM